jgi:hypothetical protein
MAALAEASAPASLAKTGASSAKKLARDVIEEFMLFFAGTAAYYQPRPPGAAPNPNTDESKFFAYAELAIKCASWLAPYQSPTYRAIEIASPPLSRSAPPEDVVFPRDPVAASRLYLRLMAAVDEKT